MTSIKRQIIRLATLAATVLLLAGCAHGVRFADAPPVWQLDDRNPIPLPEATRYIRMDYYAKTLVRRPLTSPIDFPPRTRSRDVNALDHVPASTWYTPRLGYREITPERLLEGPRRIGPPQPPVRVVRAKSSGSNPGFVIADSRDRLYLIKFDPRNNPGVETTTALIVNRMFWGFGYNVPEDYLYFFNSAEVSVDPTADITEEAVKLVFDAVAPPRDGLYRATASLLIDGLSLGPIPDEGRRKDDPNDRFDHEDMRILRALRVFCAFTNQTDIRIDNSLDVYEGMPGEGFVRHYLLDFGGAFGAEGAAYDRPWDGYTHIFSYGDVFENLLTLGLQIRDWERIRPTPWRSVGSFEARHFDPATWKETYPYVPIQRAEACDTYWAAKIVATLSRAHIAALVDAADYPEPGAAEYMIETLMQRREKVIRHYFAEVSPLESAGIHGGNLAVVDLGRRYLVGLPETRYEVRLRSDDGTQVAGTRYLRADGDQINIPLPAEAVEEADGYLRVCIRVWRGEKAAPRDAEFHLRGTADALRVVGVVH